MDNNKVKENKDDEVIVEFENVNFTYKNSSKKSLIDLNLKIKKGEIIVLTGESGCGKTTVNRCVNGLIPEFYDGRLEGRVTVCGMDITKVPLRDISRGVGSVFQDPRSQFFTLHVKTEIPFPCENYGLDREEIQNRVRDAIEDLKIESILDRSILKLSSGEKQKLAVASVYALKPKIYVLDEPSANLDGKGTRQLFEVLKILKDRGHTIIISEHKLYYLKDLLDRVVIMKKGKIERIIEGRTFAKKPNKWFENIGLRQVELETLLIPEVSRDIKDKERTQLLKVEDLAFGYNINQKLWANVSFEASEGDIIGIIGKNGVGKSSLARVLMGLEKQKDGKIYMSGKWASRRTRNKNSFYVMQDVDYQLFAPSVLEEMLVGTKVNEERIEKAKKYLKLFNLEDYKEVHPASLSGGQKQRLAIAIACMQDSKFLFLDEPTSGLDAKNMKIVSNILKELANEGRCIFVITHDYEFALNTFNRLLWFDDDGKFNSLPFHKYSNELLFSKII